MTDEITAFQLMSFGEAMDAVALGETITKQEWPAGYSAKLHDSKLMLQKPDTQWYIWSPITDGDLLGQDYLVI